MTKLFLESDKGLRRDVNEQQEGIDQEYHIFEEEKYKKPGPQGLKQSSLPPIKTQPEGKDTLITKSKSLPPPIPKPRGSPKRNIESIEAESNERKEKHIEIEEPQNMKQIKGHF